AAGVAQDGRLELKDRDLSVAQVFVAAQAEAGRVARHAHDRRVAAVALPAVDELDVRIEVAVEADIDKLRLGERRHYETRDQQQWRPAIKQGALQSAHASALRSPYLSAGETNDRSVPQGSCNPIQMR